MAACCPCAARRPSPTLCGRANYPQRRCAPGKAAHSENAAMPSAHKRRPVRHPCPRRLRNPVSARSRRAPPSAPGWWTAPRRRATRPAALARPRSCVRRQMERRGGHIRGRLGGEPVDRGDSLLEVDLPAEVTAHGGVAELGARQHAQGLLVGVAGRLECLVLAAVLLALAEDSPDRLHIVAAVFRRCEILSHVGGDRGFLSIHPFEFADVAAKLTPTVVRERAAVVADLRLGRFTLLSSRHCPSLRCAATAARLGVQCCVVPLHLCEPRLGGLQVTARSSQLHLALKLSPPLKL